MTESDLAPFVRNGRLISLPAKQTRREAVLRHLAERSFAPERTYPESEVNERLRQWCDGGQVDHVAIRRYLIDLQILSRANGVYWRCVAATPEPSPGERILRATGLE
jgi:hypothetical protein